MKYLFMMLAALALAGCQTTEPQIIYKEVYVVVTPPEALYNCPALKTIANPDTLTDEELSNLVLKLARNNKTCRTSIAALRKFYEEAKSKEH